MIRCDHLIRENQMIKCSKSEVRRLKTALRWKNIPSTQRERIQIVLMRESGMTQPAIAEVTGVSPSAVNRVLMAYDSGFHNTLVVGSSPTSSTTQSPTTGEILPICELRRGLGYE